MKSSNPCRCLFQDRPALVFELAGLPSAEAAGYALRAEEIKLRQLYREEIRMILELQDVDLKQSRFYQEVFAEGQEDGLDKGREEGREEDWKEGRKAEAVALVLRQLTRRCGPLASAAEVRVAALPVEKAEQLGEALLDFADASDLTARLQALDRSA